MAIRMAEVVNRYNNERAPVVMYDDSGEEVLGLVISRLDLADILGEDTFKDGFANVFDSLLSEDGLRLLRRYVKAGYRLSAFRDWLGDEVLSNSRDLHIRWRAFRQYECAHLMRLYSVWNSDTESQNSWRIEVPWEQMFPSQCQEGQPCACKHNRNPARNGDDTDDADLMSFVDIADTGC